MTSGILQGTHDVVLNSSQLNDYSTTITQNINNLPVNEKKGLKLLLKESMPDAFHDSSARDPPARCHPGTRENFVGKIASWGLGDSHHAQRILWMYGPAGSGKSAVAQSCAERLAEQNKLGASLFFSRPNERHDSKKLFTSLSYQIATKSSTYGDILDRDIFNDPTLLKKSRAQQFREIFVRPLQELGARGKGMEERVIIIDGLDECEGIDAQCDIIEIITASSQNGTTPFRWAFFSRPEPHIVASFKSDRVLPLSIHIELPVSREIDHEIFCYLTDEFNKIRERNGLAASWASEQDIDLLVRLCAGLFIYAATIIRFVGERNSLGPDDQLRAVFALATSTRGGTSSDNPLAELDLFYTLIMQRVPSKVLPVILKILLLRSVGRAVPIDVYANVLRFTEPQVRNAFGFLHSVLRLEPETSLIRFYHTSFLDFVQDSEQSREFCVFSAYLEVTRRGLLERLNKVHSQSMGGPRCMRATWPDPNTENLAVYDSTLLYLFRLCTSKGPLESSTAAVLADFQFQMLPRLSENLLYTGFNPERLRENIPIDFRNEVIRPSNSLWLKVCKPASADPNGLYVLGHGKNKAICYLDLRGGRYYFAPFINYHGLVDLNIDLNTIHPLFRFLPSLQHVDLVLPVWPQVWSGYVFPQTVQVLGVRVCSVKPKRQLVRWWLQILGHVVREAHESLKVQFLDEKTMEDVLVHKEYVVRYARKWNVLEWWLDPDGEVYKLSI